MMESLTVSVIVNNYNYARFLPDAIDSALSQTYEHCEVIVVDDGSTDDSTEIILRYGSRIRAVFKENGGQASALNAAFSVATGDIVVFLDSDDVLVPDAVATLKSAWRRDIARIQYPLEVIDAFGKPLGRYVGGSAAKPKPINGPFGVGSPTSGNAFSREILNRIMPIPENDWKICADAPLTAASALMGEVMCLDQVLGRYRIHERNGFSHPPGRSGIVGPEKLHALLRALVPDKIGSFEDWMGAYPQYWLDRLVSERTKSKGRGINYRVGLVRKAIVSTWRQPFWNLRRRLAYSVWILGHSVLPTRLGSALRRLERSKARPKVSNALGKSGA